MVLAHADAVQIGKCDGRAQQPERHLFLLKAGAVAHGHGGRAHFYGLAFDRQGYLAVLRQAPFRDVHRGANLQVGNDADPVVLGDRRVKNGVHAVDREPNTVVVRLRLDQNVGGGSLVGAEYDQL